MKKLLILKKVLLGLSVIGVALPFCANTANVNCGNELKVSSSSCENLLTNENMEKLGHKVFEGISQEIDDLDEENVQQIQMNVSYLLDNDLSIYFATENKVDKIIYQKIFLQKFSNCTILRNKKLKNKTVVDF